MKVGILFRNNEPFSLAVYRDELVEELKKLEVVLLSFGETEAVPAECDVVWDPGCGMRPLPRQIMESDKPSVVTVHGLRAFSLSEDDLGSEPFLFEIKHTLFEQWLAFRKRVAAVIAVSMFGAAEVIRTFAVSADKVFPIYHGVNHKIFNSEAERHTWGKPHFLHVSQYQPKKNINRILAAYSRLDESRRPDLIIVSPGFVPEMKPAGVKFAEGFVSHHELSTMYRGALAFIFPSLHETFGMPILEAMACGCPVITSSTTACAEVVGEAAVLVDPYSLDDISEAMQRLTTDKALRRSIITKGLLRAKEFTWEKSAKEHLRVLKTVYTAASGLDTIN